MPISPKDKLAGTCKHFSRLINQFATEWSEFMPHNWTQLHPLHLFSSHHYFSFPAWVLCWVKRDIGSSWLHSFHLAKKVIYHPNCLSFSFSISNCVSLSPSSRLEWAGVRLWPQEAVNSLENGRCLMGRHTGPPPTHSPPQNDPWPIHVFISDYGSEK